MSETTIEQRLEAEIVRREVLEKELKDKNIVKELTDEWNNILDLLKAIRDDELERYLSS